MEGSRNRKETEAESVCGAWHVSMFGGVCVKEFPPPGHQRGQTEQNRGWLQGRLTNSAYLGEQPQETLPGSPLWRRPVNKGNDENVKIPACLRLQWDERRCLSWTLGLKRESGIFHCGGRISIQGCWRLPVEKWWTPSKISRNQLIISCIKQLKSIWCPTNVHLTDTSSVTVP